jgi:hypothetical protein
MACTCTGDKEQIGNTIIGRNKVTCQECLDAQVLIDKQRRVQEIDGLLTQIDLKSIRGLREGNKSKTDVLEAQAVVLRNERNELTKEN